MLRFVATTLLLGAVPPASAQHNCQLGKLAQHLHDVGKSCCAPPGPPASWNVFNAKLGAKNGVSSHEYEFKVARLPPGQRGGRFSSRMVEVCRKYKMKPVCDHPSYCKNDGQALYIGQSNHMAYRPHRNNNSYQPGGFQKIRDKWNNLCSYTNNANSNQALCNIPVNSHSWQ